MANTNSIILKDPFLAEELKAGETAGLFNTPTEFIKESVNTFLAARKDVRITIACELYKEDKISIGKASEIADLGIEEMKKELNMKGIKRKLTDIVEEKKMANAFIKKNL